MGVFACVKLLFTDYTDSHVLNAEFQHYSVVIKVASKVFCQCLYILGHDVIPEWENMWSGVMNEGPTKYYKSQH